jgi:hypothetical protein
VIVALPLPVDRRGPSQHRAWEEDSNMGIHRVPCSIERIGVSERRPVLGKGLELRSTYSNLKRLTLRPPLHRRSRNALTIPRPEIPHELHVQHLCCVVLSSLVLILSHDPNSTRDQERDSSNETYGVFSGSSHWVELGSSTQLNVTCS